MIEKERKLGPMIRYGMFLGCSKGPKVPSTSKYGVLCRGNQWTLGESEVPGTEPRSHSKYIMAVNCPH